MTWQRVRLTLFALLAGCAAGGGLILYFKLPSASTLSVSRADPAGSQTSPVGSQATPAGSQTTPVGSQATPAGSQTTNAAPLTTNGNEDTVERLRLRLEYENTLTEAAHTQLNLAQQAAEHVKSDLTQQLQACKASIPSACTAAPDKATAEQFAKSRAAIEETMSQLDSLIQTLKQK
jgi:hypothetical protein